MANTKAAPVKAAPVTVQDMLVRVLCAAVAAWLAMKIDAFLVSNYASARFWETWVDTNNPVHAWVPVVAFAAITGIAVGVTIGLVFPQHIALKIAAVAAALQLVAFILDGGITALASPIVIGISLLMGALPSRLTR
jgi:hypothetical protein